MTREEMVLQALEECTAKGEEGVLKRRALVRMAVLVEAVDEDNGVAQALLRAVQAVNDLCLHTAE